MKPILAILLFALVCVNHRIQFANASRPFSPLSKLESLSLVKRDAPQEISEESDSSSDSSDESSISETSESRDNPRVSSPSATAHQPIPTKTPPCSDSEPKSSPQTQTGIIDTLKEQIENTEERIKSTAEGAISNVRNTITETEEAIKHFVEREIIVLADLFSAPIRLLKTVQTVINIMRNPWNILSRSVRAVGEYNTGELSNSMKMAPRIIKAIAGRTPRELSNSMKMSPRIIRSIGTENAGVLISSMIMDPKNIRTITEYISEVSSNSMKMAPRSIRAAVENSYPVGVSAYDIMQKFQTLIQSMANAPPKERERYIQIAQEISCLAKEWLNYGTCSGGDMPDITALKNQLSWQVAVDNLLTWINDHLTSFTEYGLLTKERAESLTSIIQTLKSLMKLMSMLQGNQ